MHGLHLGEYLYALRYNAQLLLEKNNLCRGAFLNATDFHEKYLKQQRAADGEMAQRLYEECSDKITRALFLASSKQEMPLLFLALLSMFYLFLVLLKPSILKQSQLEFVLHLCVIGAQLFAAFQVFVYITAGILAALSLLQLKRIFSVKKSRPMPDFLIMTCLGHPLTFVSTSFIEEEHYFWIFVSVTFVLVSILQSRRVSTVDNGKLMLLLAGLRFSMDLNSTVENSVQNQSNWANILNYDQNLVYYHAFVVSSLVFVWLTLYFEHEKAENLGSLLLSALTLFLIYLLKFSTYHNTWLGKGIWTLIGLQKLVFAGVSWKEIWILSTTLLIKPHNVVLIPLGVYSANQLSAVIKDCSSLTIASYLLSNCFYFLQGHRNSLASVDVSMGYTGLNDYYPFLVISQVLIHTYTFPVIFHLTLFQRVFQPDFETRFWNTMLAIRTSVVFATGLVMILFRHHLFIWSVFAPKLIIESVHTGFMFIELSFWYLNKLLSRFYVNKR